MTDKALSFDGMHLLQSKDKTRKNTVQSAASSGLASNWSYCFGRELAQPPPVSAIYCWARHCHSRRAYRSEL